MLISNISAMSTVKVVTYTLNNPYMDVEGNIYTWEVHKLGSTFLVTTDTYRTIGKLMIL